MTEKGYISDLYRQLQEVMNKCDNLSLQVKNIKKEHCEEINILNNNSNNSSKPPSSDIKPNKKDIQNNREKTGKTVGGQIGHKGVHLSKKYVE